MQKNEEKVLEALRDPNWDWRTLAGLERTTGLPRPVILEVLCTHDLEIEARTMPQHGMVFRLRTQEKHQSLLEKTLDYLSLGAR